ncbi:MAG: hypothetical protein F6K30_22850 [Cyanothece sp. SIO2G6]|nr:hypothetical protein [Cyanothece sp. SIO2G6]
MIDIDVASKTISVGDVVEGVTSWQLSDNNSIPKSLTVSLGWWTEGRGNKNEETVQALRLDADDLRSLFSQRLPFSFPIPDDAPIIATVIFIKHSVFCGGASHLHKIRLYVLN